MRRLLTGRNVSKFLGILFCILFPVTVLQIINKAVEKGLSIWAGLYIFVIAVVIMVLTFVAIRGSSKVMRIGRVAIPTYLFGLYASLIALVPAMSDNIMFWESRPEGLDADIARLKPKIEGFWGEPGCTSVHKFSINNRALTIEWVRRPPGHSYYRTVGTIIAADSDSLKTEGEEPLAAREKTAEFTYWTNGEVKRLKWRVGRRETEDIYDRCS